MQLWSVLEKNLITEQTTVIYEHLTNRDASISCDRLRRKCQHPFEYSYYLKAESEED